MHTLTHEVKASRLPLVIQFLEFNAPLEEKLVGKEQLFLRDTVLVDDPNSSNKFAEVRVVWRG